MKIVLVSLARRGGMVHFLAEVAEGLAKFAHVAVIVSSQASLDYLAPSVEKVALDTGTGRLGSLARLFSPITWYRLAGNIRTLRPDVVHLTGAHEWNPLVAILSKLQGRPLVYTVHDPESHPGAPWAIRLGNWLTSRLATKKVTLTVLGRRQLLARGESPNSVDVVPHPIYTLFRRWKPDPERPRKIILCFGRLEAYKGLKLLVEAFLSVRPSLPGWTLIIAGDGRLPEELAIASGSGIEVINRYVPDAEVARLMSRCSIVALPYSSATQSGVIALAQALCRPVVATAVGGLTEMVIQGRTGILVRPGDRAAFGRALRGLAANPARRARMRREIRMLADARWGQQAVAEAYLRVYAAVVPTSRDQ
jgi:glycosyltransferase involved in cell wall biosynthesis